MLFDTRIKQFSQYKIGFWGELCYIYGMEFFTKVELPKAGFKIDYTSKLAFFGSCFADNIAAQFAARKFRVLSNPFGTVYNPLSIERQLKLIASGKTFGEEDVFQDTRACPNASENQDARRTWHSWDAHSSLSAANREECIAKLNAASSQAREFLQQADTIFITLGSAFVYSLNGQIVANCHRQDPHLFERRMITVNESAEAIRGIVESICRIKNRDWILRWSLPRTSSGAQDDTNATSHPLHIVFTVSPLRHMGDGAHGNNLSKSTLLLAVEKTLSGMQASANPAEYFPSYEIVMDELRDYRFYESDMVHLSKTAEEYIFEKMLDTYCDGTTRANIARVEKFMKMANHRIADASIANEFLQKINCEASILEAQIPGLDLGQ